MRGWAILPALLLAGCAPQPHAAGGIVSTNPCADAMLVGLVAPERIAAISHYSREAAATSIPLEVARRFHTTAGIAEEVIALRPALVVASSFTAPATRAAFARAGLDTLYLDSPTTIAASEEQILDLARATESEPRGKEMVAKIERALAASAPAGTNRPAALAYIGGNLASGSGNLLDELLARAGFRNAAGDYGLAFTGTVPIETVVAHPPRVVLTPDPEARAARARADVLARFGARVSQARLERRLVNCGGPSIPAALARLAAIRRVVTS